MTAVVVLARQVLADAARERLFYVVAIFAAALALLAPWVADLSLAAPTRAVRDLGLTFAWVTCSGTAIWLGIRAIGVDLRSRAAALVLSGPVSRRAWLLGRSIGVFATLALEVLALVVAYAAVAAALSAGPSIDLLWFAVLLWAECCVLAAMAGLLGIVAAPGLATACAIALWAAGHLANEYTAATAESPFLARIAFAIVPDLDLFTVQGALVHGAAVDPVRAALALVYALLWVVGLLSLATILVERTDAA